MIEQGNIGKYQLIRYLGGGQFGDVYLAYDRVLQSTKAIKVVRIANPSQIKQKLEEAQILDKCRHKHIVAINDANLVEIENTAYLVLDLEYLPEGSLESRMQDAWISVKEACTRMACVLSGLDYAHSNEYLHRDVKPGNVLIDRNNTKLSDFGLATALQSMIGSFQGYRPHLPPECYVTGETNVLSDVYATGMTLFRVVNNYVDWDQRLTSIPNLENSIRSGKLIDRIGFQEFVPNKVRRVVRKACHLVPVERYPSALAMMNDIDALRFGIEWHKTNDTVWSGFYDGIDHKVEVLSKRNEFHVVYRKNSRRVNERCSVHTTMKSAKDKQTRIVMETTLR